MRIKNKLETLDKVDGINNVNIFVGMIKPQILVIPK